MQKDTINFKERLKEQGYKLTPQRQAVLDMIIEHDGEHLSTEEIYDLVKQKYPDIGLATVYRTLLLFDSIGLVYKLNFDDGLSRYEISNQNEDHRHHHLICMRCGKVLEVQEDLLDDLEEQILNKNRFKVVDHRVKFYGYCGDCMEAKEVTKIVTN